MIPARILILTALLCAFANARSNSALPLSGEQQSWIAKAHRSEKAGWVYLHVEGEPHDRGFQRGYLLAREIADGLHNTRISWEHQSAMDWKWLVNEAAPMFLPKIDA